MDYEFIRAFILLTGWPILIIGSIYLVFQSFRFYNNLDKSVVGKLVISLSGAILVLMYSLGFVATSYMNNNLDMGVNFVLPIFAIWFILMTGILLFASRLDKQAVALNSKNKALDKAKDDFLIVASHQLRTPLTGVKWSLELLQQNQSLSSDAKTVIDTVYNSNEKLINLVNNLLSTIRIDSQKVTKKIENFDLIVLLNETLNALRPIASKKNQSILTEFPTSFIVNKDKFLLQESFKNILSNAIKYGSENSSIKVRLFDLDKEISLEVNNQGSTIHQDDIQNIFNKFSRKNKDGGNLTQDVGGLGLYITKYFIEQNGGRINVNSNSSIGTTFIITLPKN